MPREFRPEDGDWKSIEGIVSNETEIEDVRRYIHRLGITNNVRNRLLSKMRRGVSKELN